MSLPPGTWYDFYSGVSTFSSTEHAKLPVPTKLYQLPVFMRGGSAIMVYQGLTGTNSMKVKITIAIMHLEMSAYTMCKGTVPLKVCLS